MVPYYCNRLAWVGIKRELIDSNFLETHVLCCLLTRLMGVRDEHYTYGVCWKQFEEFLICILMFFTTENCTNRKYMPIEVWSFLWNKIVALLWIQWYGRKLKYKCNRQIFVYNIKINYYPSWCYPVWGLSWKWGKNPRFIVSKYCHTFGNIEETIVGWCDLYWHQIR